MTAKEWNISKNIFRKTYNTLKANHPDWSNQRVYMATKSLVNSSKTESSETATEQPVIVLHKNLMTNDTVTLDIFTDGADMGKVFELNNIKYNTACPNRYIINIKDLANVIMLSNAMPAKIEVILTIHNGIGFGTDYDMMLVTNALWKNNIKYDVSYEDVFVEAKDLYAAVTAIAKVGLSAELM